MPSELPTRAELREEIDIRVRLALAEQFQKIVVLMIAMHTFSVTLMAALFLFSQG